jgi:glycosyltransferase involved in cell wall biosynthesis
MMPKVWYIAAGYNLPAGIEAYLLHYATEMRRRGFDCRIVVFERLPKVEHRYLRALRERGIPIESLYAKVRWRVSVVAGLTFLPWKAWRWMKRRGLDSEQLTVNSEQWTVSSEKKDVNDGGGTICHGCLAGLRRDYGDLRYAIQKRLAVRCLASMIEESKPDVIHVKGRIITEAMAVLPSDRTIYQHALMGTRDPSWTDSEAEAFSVFLNRIALILVQARSIAETFAQSFNVSRRIDVVFTMAPDELTPGTRETTDYRLQTIDRRREDKGGVPQADYPESGGERNEVGSKVHGLGSSVRSLRFGILCRFTEQKGIQFILEAIKLYRERHGDVRFTFAGQGPLEETIRQFASSNGLPHVTVERVTAPGGVLENLDVFVHPGLDDAMPVSIVEALMFGVPCIGSNVGGVPELVREGVEGFLVPPGSSEAIAAAMDRFAALTPGEYLAFRHRARCRYEEACHPDVVSEVVERHYRSVMVKESGP